MHISPFGFQRVKVIALAVADLDRATIFYSNTLELALAYEGGVQVGYMLGTTTLVLMPVGYAEPTEQPNPRITIATDHAPDTERMLLLRGVVISDPVRVQGESYVGSFLDSEGNKLWFCSPVV